MLRSHLERGPAEFVKLKIWASSESLPGFGRALCDSHIQIGCLAYIFRTDVGPSTSELWLTPAGSRPSAIPICRISGPTTTTMNACSMGKFGRGGITRPGPLYWGQIAREVQNPLKSSQLFNSAWKCDEDWAILKFWQRSHRSPHKFADFPLDLSVFLVAWDIFTYSF